MKTNSGTEFPLLNLRGKEYLEVKYRIAWFREEHPDFTIETDLKSEKTAALCKATIKDSSGRTLSTAHKYEDIDGFKDFREKCETGAIGRALALLGYGTVNAIEFEEGDRVVDAPVQKKTGEQTSMGHLADEKEAEIIKRATMPKQHLCLCGETMRLNKDKTWFFCPDFKDGKKHSSVPNP